MTSDAEPLRPDRIARADAQQDRPRHHSVVLETCVHLVLHAILATSLFFLFAGHNAPGGGFIGGLVAGTALVLRYLVGSGTDMSRQMRVGPVTLLGSGLMIAVGTSMAPWLLGGQLLESAYVYVDLPVLGKLPLASALAFDTGVYLIVIGIVLGVLSTLGSQTEASLDAAAHDDEGASP